MESLRGLGAHVVYENKVVTVTPGPVPAKSNVAPHESGTTLRLLLPVAASICNDVDVDAKRSFTRSPSRTYAKRNESTRRNILSR